MLSFVAGISGLYDLIVGAFLLLAADSLASLFGVPAANPRIFSDLNGLFLIAVGAGYYLPFKDPVRYRGYLWVMGPLLKGAGAAAFVLDYVFRGSPVLVPALRGIRRGVGAADALGAAQAATVVASGGFTGPAEAGHYECPSRQPQCWASTRQSWCPASAGPAQ